MQQEQKEEEKEGEEKEMNFIKSAIGTSLSGLMKGHSGITHNKKHPKFIKKKRKRKLAKKSRQKNRG